MEEKDVNSQSIVISEGVKGLSTPKRRFTEVITSAIIVGALLEVGKAAIGFFAGILLKKWWDKRETKKEDAPNNDN